MNLLAIAALAGLAAGPPPLIPPASIDDGLEVTGESVAAEQQRSRMFVPVEVNGQGPFRFLVDSGADRSVIGVDLAARLALPTGRAVRLQGMAGPARVDTVRLDTLKIGTSVIDGIAAPALPERFIGAQGLLGIDALADQRLMLDFDAKTVTVQDSRRPETMLEPGEIVVTARRRRGQLILTQASVRGHRIYAVIDTGAELSLGNSALRAQVFGSRPPKSQPVTLISVTGAALEAELVILPEVRIGGIVMRGVPVAFADAPPFALFGLDKQPALLLGTDLLKAFKRVSLDFRHRKVRFVLRRQRVFTPPAARP